MLHEDGRVRFFTHGVTLAYRCYGTGAEPLLALHGFGRTGADFAILEEYIGDRYAIHAFDLHFHGSSPGYPHRADEPFAPHEIARYFAAFADAIGAQRLSLLGYSL
ncbi:MAG: alpha/beta fold hydrolase, partial [Flavobacteriales bacterium]